MPAPDQPSSTPPTRAELRAVREAAAQPEPLLPDGPLKRGAHGAHQAQVPIEDGTGSDVPPLPADTPAPDRRPHIGHLILNLIRGALIGTAELIPGISGGTVALITGVYERLIDGASHVISAFKRLVVGPNRGAGFAAEIKRVDWWLVVPVLVGMVGIVLTLAGIVEGLVTANVEASRGLFFGLVAASIAVPLGLLPRVTRTTGRVLAGVALFVGAAMLAFVTISFAGGGEMEQPELWVIFVAAAIAICALVVPGLSGSFFLLAVGLYTPTLRALDERNWAYIGVFMLGAIVGLVSIVRIVKWMLTRHRWVTLVAMAGLMLGSLRALWPWQSTPDGDSHGVGALQAPNGEILLPIVLAVLGAAAVIILLLVENRLRARVPHPAAPSLDV